MADIRLVRPEAGTNQAVACEPEAKFVFDFPTDAATLSRNGDNLVMTFEDGATLTLTDFYKAYSSKNMPSFEVDGAQVAGADFFAAMNEPDLMPAAGPGGRGAAGVGGARYHEYANMALYDGLDRLGGLDVGWPDGGYEPEIDGAAGRRGDEGYLLAGIPDGIPSITPDDPETLDPDTPVFPPHDPDEPYTPGGNMNPSTVRDVLHVYESGLKDGTAYGSSDAPTTVAGSMHVESPDGVDRLEVGGEVVYENGQFTSKDIPTDEGVLHVTDFNSDTGELSYNYELQKSSPEHSENGADKKFGHDIPVTVTDPDGDSASSTITVVVEDDAPEAKNDSVTLSEGQSVAGSVLDGTAEVTVAESGRFSMQETRSTGDADVYGADRQGTFEKGASVQWKVPKEWAEVEGQSNTWRTPYGDITLNEDGTYTFKTNPNAPLAEGAKDELSLSYTITDGDGDESTADLTITVEGKNDNVTIIPSDNPVAGSVSSVTVYEAGLEKGTEPNAPGYPTHAGNNFTVEAKDGLRELEINGKPVWRDGELVEENCTIEDKEGNILHITGVEYNDDGTYTVTYDYTLHNRHEHGVPGRGDMFDRSFTVKATDVDGQFAEGTIKATVVDDAPRAQDDFAGTVTEHSNERLAGNVVTGEVSNGTEAGAALKQDQHGADEQGTFENGASVQWNVSGQEGWTKADEHPEGGVTYHTPYGDLTLYDDGRYDFHANADPEVHNNLGPDEKETLKVPYTIKDSEGDTASADLTITVKGGDDNHGSIREAGVRGHYNADSPNAGVWTDENLHLQGRIEGGADGLTITGVTTTHFNRERDGSDPTADVDADNIDTVDGDALPRMGDSGELTLYVVKDDDGNFTVTDDKPEDNNFYGTLTLKENAEKGSVDWDFHLNTENKDLINSLNEGEEVKVELEYSVNGEEESHTLDVTIKGTDDQPQVGRDYTQNDGIQAGMDFAHVEDTGVTDGLGWSGTFWLPAGKEAPTGDYNEFVGVPGFGIQFNVGGEDCLFFQQWFQNGWGSADFVLKNGSIFHVEVTEKSPDGWKFSYSITPGKGQPGSENDSQCPDITVELKDQKYEDDWHSVGTVTSPGGPNENGLTVYSSDIPFNAAGRHVPSAKEGRLEDYDPRGDRSQQLEFGTHGNKENTPWEGIPVVRLGIKATDPDADGWSGQNLFEVDETTGRNKGIREGAKVGFRGWNGKLYTWGSTEEFKAVCEECIWDEHHLGWAIGYGFKSLGYDEIEGIPPGDYLVHPAAYGFFFIDQWGNIFYMLDTRDGSDADKLPEGVYVNDVREFVVQDAHGAWSSNYFGVTVKGSNEAPELQALVGQELSSPSDNSNELVTLTGHAQATDRDVIGKDKDGEEVHEKVEYFLVDKDGNLVDSVQTEHGRVTIDPETGKFTYTLDSTDEKVTHLKDYDSRGEDEHQEGVDFWTDEFFVGARDPHGAVDIKKQEITIKGTNSAPHIESVTDDGSDGLSFQLKEAGVKVGKDDVGGNEDNNYTVKDEGRSVLKGHVEAKDINDANKPEEVENKLTYSFEVNGDTQTVPDSADSAHSGFTHHVTTEYGDLWYNEYTGDYQYELDPGKTNSLSEGEIVEQKVTVTVTDDGGAQDTSEFTVHIVGTNDAPQFVGDDGTALANDASVGLEKDKDGRYSATLEAVDPDSDSKDESGKSNLDFTFKAQTDQEGQLVDGSPNPGINQSQSFATDLGTFSIADEHTGTVTFTANPTSDLMEAARDHLRSFFKKDKPGELELNDTGREALESNLIEQASSGGGLNFTEKGWQEWLNEIKDKPELKDWLEKNNAEITEDGKLVVHADVYAVDQYGAADTVDVTVELAPPSVPGDGPELKMPDTLTYGDLNVRESGQVDNLEVAGYDQRDRANVEFSLPEGAKSTDQYGFTFVPTTNDGNREDVQLNGSSQSIVTPYGTLTINPDTGEVEFVLDNSSSDVQKLKDQDEDRFLDALHSKLEKYFEDHSIVVYEKSNPGNNKEFPFGDENSGLTGPKLNIYGAETPPELTVDAPVLDVDLADSDNSDKKATGKATTRDLDTLKDKLTYSVTDDRGELTPDGGPDEDGWKAYKNEYGTFHLNEKSGEYYFTADGASAKELAAGESWTGQFTITVTDDSDQTDSQEVTVQVHGANDAPEITEPAEDKLTVQDTDNTPGEVHGQLEATDPDKGDTNLTWSVADSEGKPAGNSVETDYGTFTLNPDGSYTFESNGKADENGANFKVKVVVDDGHGGTATHDLDFHINGVNDSVVLEGEGGTVTLSQLWGGVTTTNGQLEIHDLDKPGDTGFTFKCEDGSTWNWEQGPYVMKGKYGDLTVYENGHYTYRVRPEVANEVNNTQKEVKESFDLQVQMNGEESNHQNLEFTVEYDLNAKPQIEVNHDNDDPTSGSFSLSDADGDPLTYNLGAVTFNDFDVKAESDGEGHWKLYGSNEKMEDVPLGELTITKGEGDSYNYTFEPDKGWDQQGELHVELQVYDGHNTATETLFETELTNQADVPGNTISLTGQEDAQASLFSVDALSDEDGEGVFSDTDEALSADAGDVRADAYDGVMDSLSPASWEDPQDQAAGQSAPDNDLFNGDQEFGTPDDELIVYDATDYAVFGGGDGIDVLLSKNSPDTLDDLLGTPLGGQDRPHVENVELFLKGTGTDAEGNTFSVEDLTSLSDLAEKAGITVDNASGTVTLDERWEKTDDGTYASKDGLTLETTLADVTPKSTDAAATQAANEILLTQQG